MNMSKSIQNEMIRIVSDQLKKSSLPTSSPELLARHLLSYYDYDLNRVLDLAV
jgi:hypothetical protein